jgi:hypothetical protein
VETPSETIPQWEPVNVENQVDTKIKKYNMRRLRSTQKLTKATKYYPHFSISSTMQCYICSQTGFVLSEHLLQCINPLLDQSTVPDTKQKFSLREEVERTVQAYSDFLRKIPATKDDRRARVLDAQALRFAVVTVTSF